MKIQSLLLLLLSGYALCNTINNVRLVDHTSYAIDVVTKTMNIVEERGWCNLKLPEYVLEISENILVAPFRGSVRYINGFVSSIQHVDIEQSTVQQVWRFNASAASTHTVTVQARLRMHDLAVGYDVIGHLTGDTEVYRYTVVYSHPLISFDFSIIKDLHTGVLTAAVLGTVPRTTSRLPEFRPKDLTSDIFLQAFDPISVTASGILAWTHDVFEPIALDLVRSEITFPTICYNCAV